MIDRHGFLGRERLLKGPWSAFERSIGRMLIHSGWDHVSITGGTGDRGADIIASFTGSEWVYQVKFKRNGGGIGKEIIDDVKRAMEYYNIPNGCAVTNGYLTRSANSYYQSLKRDKYNIKVLEGRKILEINSTLTEWPVKDREIREYQFIAVDRILNQFKQGDRRALLVLATGLGKTFVAGKFLKNLYRQNKDLKVLVLAHKVDLIRQLEIAMWPHLPKYAATHLWDQGEKPAFDAGVTFATFQSVLSAIENDYDFPAYNVLIIDECHHAAAETFENIINYFNPDFLLGMTATPFRSDNREISNIFGPPVFEMGIIEGMRNGYLTKVDYRVLTDNIDWEHVPAICNDRYSVKDLNKKMFIPQRDDEIINIIKDTWQANNCKRGIIFCASIQHCKAMEIKLLDRGFRSRGLFFGLDQRSREAYLREFRQGKLDFLLAVDILNEGIDIPEVDLIIFLRVTHSRIIFLQQLGRGLRIAENKLRVIVLDFVADIRRVAGVMSVTSGGYEREDYNLERIEIPEFQVLFSDKKSKTLFQELVQDKLEIENIDERDELFLGGVQ